VTFLETHRRSILKTITFRIIATITTFILVLIITGDLMIASVIGILDTILKLFIYYSHERVWNKISWGMKSR
jgi:adenylylsulfate kinase